MGRVNKGKNGDFEGGNERKMVEEKEESVVGGESHRIWRGSGEGGGYSRGEGQWMGGHD